MCNKQNIKVTEGNAFALLLPLKARTYTADGVPVDEDLNPHNLTDVVVKIGDTAYTYTLEDTGVQVIVPGTLKRGTYDVVLTGKHEGADIRAAWFELLTIVTWNYQSDAEQYLPGSPIIAQAAVIVSGALTDAELEALKEEYREKNAQLAQAIEDAEAAKEHYDELAEQLQGVAQEQTLTDGVTAIRDDISHIDIDTSTLAKETSVKDGNDTAIGVSKEIRSEVGTGSDTAAETGTLFAVVKWVKDKVKSIFNYIGTPASGQPSTLFAAIAAGGGGGGDAQESTSQAILSLVQEISDSYVLHASLSGYVFANGTNVQNPGSLFGNCTSLIEIHDSNLVSVSTSNNGGGYIVCTSLRIFDATNLERANINQFLRNIYSLREVNFPKLKLLSQAYFCNGCSALRKVNILKLETNTSSYTLGGCSDLIDIIYGAGALTNTAFLSDWSPTNALRNNISTLVEEGESFANNLEKLLYNIREHIAANLPDRTGDTALTITFSAAVKAAIQADTATSNAFTNKNWTIA